MSERSLMILIAGPYRSATGDDPERMANNLCQLEPLQMCLDVSCRHLAVTVKFAG
jgi:hypothetical protein